MKYDTVGVHVCNSSNWKVPRMMVNMFQNSVHYKITNIISIPVNCQLQSLYFIDYETYCLKSEK